MSEPTGRPRVRSRASARSAALILLLAGGACVDAEEPAPASASGDGARPAVPRLGPQRIAELVATFPRLGPEPLPAPRPSPDADPTDVPDLPEQVLETVTGEATFYADLFEGRRTASGIPFRQNQMVAAHRAYPFGTILRVTNLLNDRSTRVRVVDRGPFGPAAEARGTILDLSRRAAEALGYLDRGRTPIRVEVLEWGDGLPV